MGWNKILAGILTLGIHPLVRWLMKPNLAKEKAKLEKAREQRAKELEEVVAKSKEIRAAFRDTEQCLKNKALTPDARHARQALQHNKRDLEQQLAVLAARERMIRSDISRLGVEIEAVALKISSEQAVTSRTAEELVRGRDLGAALDESQVRASDSRRLALALRDQVGEQEQADKDEEQLERESRRDEDRARIKSPPPSAREAARPAETAREVETVREEEKRRGKEGDGERAKELA